MRPLLSFLSIALVAPISGAVAAPLSFSDTGTFTTEDAAMFGDRGPAVLDADYYAVRSGRLPSKSVGAIGTVPNPLFKIWDDAIEACVKKFSTTRNRCRDGYTIPGIITIPGIGPAPAETLANGARLNIRDAEVNLGLNARLELAPGTVDAAQSFEVDVHVSQDSFEKGDIVTITTEKTLGQSGLSSELSVLDMSVSSLTDLAYDIELEGFLAGVRSVEKIADVDTGLKKTEILGLEIGDAALDLRTLGNSNIIPLSNGISYEIPAPVLPPPLSTYVKFPIADVTGYIPAWDVPETLSAPGTPGVSVETEFGERTSDTPITGDFAKTDLDLDVATVLASRIPLGLEGRIPLLAKAQINVLDADLGGYFNVAQKQEFRGEEIDVRLTFSVPVAVEVSPGVFKLVSSHIVRAGDAFNFRHPGGDLKVDREYVLAENRYTNSTGFVFAPAFTYKFLNAEFSLLSGVFKEEFSVLEDVLEIGDKPIPLGSPIFDGAFALDGFSSVAGTSFLLAASDGPIGPATVPLPAAGWMLLASVFGLAGISNRRRKQTS